MSIPSLSTEDFQSMCFDGLTPPSSRLFFYKSLYNIIVEQIKNGGSALRIKLALLLASAMIFSPGVSLAQDKGGVINVATIGEPPTLDPMVSTADLVGIVTQHIFETLYTFEADAIAGRKPA